MTAASVALAGCSSVTGGLKVQGVDAAGTAFGNVNMAVQVENTASDSKSGTLVGQVDMNGGDTYTEQRSITVNGGTSNTFELSFDIGLDDSISSGSYEYSAQIE